MATEGLDWPRFLNGLLVIDSYGFDELPSNSLLTL
jgi:hypothetical protein